MRISPETLIERSGRARRILGDCMLCPRDCRVNRMAGELGYCGIGARARISSFGPHFGEEPPLVGRCGSGTIFYARCNMGCLFCQNYEISQYGEGDEVTGAELARIMCSLQSQGCHNINLVTPTHVVPQILEAFSLAQKKGLRIPIVYNCGGYESLPTLRLLEGIIDIYMPDAKYASEEIAQQLSDAPDYPEVMRQALKEMHRQVGDLEIDPQGIATRGLLVRHLVLPHGLAGTRKVMHFLAQEISLHTYLNIMDQYRPVYRAHGHHRIGRRITLQEYRDAIDMALQEGLHRGF